MRKVKRKFSPKKTIKILIPLILILLIIINWNNILITYQSKITGYEKNTISLFHELKIYDKIKDKKHSDTLEKIITTEYYNSKYLSNYLDINYKNENYFFENINKLLALNYTSKEINTIYDKLSSDSIQILSNNNYLKDILNIISLDYFKEDNLKRYIDYSNNKDIEYTDLITYVNAYLDYDYYTNIVEVENPDDILVLTNKYHKLSSSYVPSDLETISNKYNKGNNNKMRHDAKIAFEDMCEAARSDNIYIYSGSAYRSYSYQENLYNRYVRTNGFADAETFSARAGHSEHQTGLATDIMNSRDYISENDKEYTWLVDNSYKYGFILRYPKGKESITGYMYEEWHFRYVGKEVAKELKELDLTYEEYIARELEKK